MSGLPSVTLPQATDIVSAFRRLWDKPDGTYTTVRGVPLRYVTLPFGFKLLEQNPYKPGSEWAAKARDGSKIAWLIMDNTSKRYWARVENEEIHWT